MGNKTKVLHIFSTFKSGGMEAHLLNFFNHADFDKFEHYIFVSRDEGQLREYFHKLPLKIITLKSTPKHYIYSLPYGFYFCRKNKVNIINGHNFWSYLYCYFLSLLTGIPFITVDYGLGTWKKKIHLLWESVIFKRAGINLALSRAILDKDLSLIRNEGSFRQKFEILYPIIKSITAEDISHHDKKSIKEVLGIKNNNPVLTIVGRIIKLKGHRFAIDAVNRINREETKVNLLIVGRLDDPSVLREEDINKEYIIYKNYYERLEEIWSVTDIFIIPSVSEGTPLVLVEYFSIGKPVIASNISGNKELIRDGWNGFLFEKGDVDNLVSKIEFVVSFEDINTVIDNANKYYIQSLSPVMQTRKVEAFYTEYALPIS